MKTIALPSFRRHAASLAVAVVLAFGASASSAQRLDALAGEGVSEAELNQGATIVVFWSTWSPHSRDIVSRINPLVDRWSGSARVVAVNFQEDRESITSFLAGKGMKARVLLDPNGTFTRKFQVTKLPVLLVLRDGQVAYNGPFPQDPDGVLGEIFR